MLGYLVIFLTEMIAVFAWGIKMEHRLVHKKHRRIVLYMADAMAVWMGGVFLWFCFREGMFLKEYVLWSVTVCGGMMLIWEIGLYRGWIPGTQDYRDLLRQSDMAVQIVDSFYNVKYDSKKAPTLDEATIIEAKRHPVLLDEDTRLLCAPIRGGKILWTENISEENRMLKALEEAKVRLSEKNTLLQAENELKEQKAKVEQQSILYDNIAREIEPALERMEQQLELEAKTAEEKQHRLATVCVIGAYIKRRSNLILISENKEWIPSEELGYCLRESVSYLKVYGVYCAFAQQGTGLIRSEQAKLLYDFFEETLRCGAKDMTTMLVSLIIEESLIRLKMSMEYAAALPDPMWESEKIFSMGGKISSMKEEGTDYLTLTLARGGVPS